MVNILLVEDDKDLNQIICKHLNTHGYQVIDLDQNIILNCDEELLDIVWNNLISNALKFIDANGIVAITARIENENIVVSVRDNGIGISTPAIGCIFDKFYQEDTK